MFHQDDLEDVANNNDSVATVIIVSSNLCSRGFSSRSGCLTSLCIVFLWKVNLLRLLSLSVPEVFFNFFFQLNSSGTEYNLTTIEPDDETIDSLIDAVDTAVTSLQNAIGTTESTDYNYDYNSNFDYNYNLDNFDPPEPPQDFIYDVDNYDTYDTNEDIDYSSGEGNI